MEIAKLGKGKGKQVKAGKGKGKGASSANDGVDHVQGTTVSASGQTVSEKQQARRSRRLARGLPDVNLWPQSTEQMGFLEDRIVMCTHAALVFADVFDVHREDLNIYWEWVNDHGGIFGRRVQMTYEDDSYRPDKAVESAERCKAKKPFILLGGLGFDQIPAVRAWNEQKQNHFLYIHQHAYEDFSKKYSFSFVPSVNQMGRLGAKWILAKHRKEKIGAVYRQSESWEPGHTAWLARMKRAGKKPVADLAVQKDQTVYTQQIAELKAKGATTVFLWENALVAIEIVKQAKNQDYHPTWLMFPFQLETDTLGRDSLNPPMEGIANWPAYVPHYTKGPMKPYAGEIRRFEAALRKYGRARNPNDILWLTWLGFKQLHQLLLDCGPNCDRNRTVALLISGRHKAVAPNCPFDFTRNQHVGGVMGSIFRTFDAPGYGPGWMQTHSCVRI